MRVTLVSLSEGTIRALISLLREQDARNVTIVERRLLELGARAFPFLEEARRTGTGDPLLRRRSDEMIHRILHRGAELRGRLRRLTRPKSIIQRINHYLVAKRLRLPIEGVGMPGHFLVVYRATSVEPKASNKIEPKASNKVEILIDPFHVGRIVPRDECLQVLREAGYAGPERLLRPVGAREILARSIRNLIGIYAGGSDPARAETLARFLRILPGEDGPPG